MHIEKKMLRNIFLGVAACILLYWLLHETERVKAVFGTVADILSPFVVGAALAFIMNVPMRAIERWIKGIKPFGLRRGLSIVLTVLAVLGVVTLVFWLLIPQLIETFENLVETVPEFYYNAVDWINNFLLEHPDLMAMVNEYTDFESIDWSAILDNILSVLTGSISSMAEFVINTIKKLSAGIYDAVLSVIFCLYALIRKEILARQGRRIIYSILPEKICDETIRVLRMSNATFSHFISGQCLEAIILGALFAVCMAIFNMPFIPLISVAISITALIPIVGAFVGCIIGAFFIFMQDPMLAVWFVVMFLILQQIENNLIYPKVVGTSVGLPGMWVLVAVGIGGDLMGVAGMLLMIPATSVLYALAREFTTTRVKQRNIDPDKLLDQPPEITNKFKEKRKVRRAIRIHRRTVRRAKRKGEQQPEEDED